MPSAVITGAASGLGKELAILLERDGYDLYLWDRNINGLKELKESLGPRTQVYEVDLSNEEQITKAKELVLAQMKGKIDLVVANAGLGGVNPGTSFSNVVNNKIFQVNTLGAINTLTAFLPSMLKRNSGQLVGISSLASLRGLPGGASYSSSKAALNNFCESLALDLAHTNINVTNVLPGFIQTPMVNHDEFPTPFSVPVEKAATKTLRAIKQKRTRYLFPFPMVLLSMLNTLFPSWLYVRLAPLFAPKGSAQAKVF